MIGDKELLDGNRLLLIYHKSKSSMADKWREMVVNYSLDDFSFVRARYDLSWDLLHEVIDIINAKGKAYNLAIFKTYLAMSVEKDSKYFKDFHFAHSEYVTSEQTSKEAAFRLLVKYLEWEDKNNLTVE